MTRRNLKKSDDERYLVVPISLSARHKKMLIILTSYNKQKNYSRIVRKLIAEAFAALPPEVQAQIEHTDLLVLARDKEEPKKNKLPPEEGDAGGDEEESTK